MAYTHRSSHNRPPQIPFESVAGKSPQLTDPHTARLAVREPTCRNSCAHKLWSLLLPVLLLSPYLPLRCSIKLHLPDWTICDAVHKTI